ncbi:MAG TPA: hypothetical protein ENK10_09665 [Acidobacteria bacterium]|nr:hypothetical protein [Acidobacteriota bacterium]
MSRDDHRSLHPAEQNIRCLQQGRELLAGLSTELYSRCVLTGASGSVGGQFRHCIDYYHCLLRGAASARIDYDRRERNPALEQDPAAAREALADLERRLAEIDGDLACRVVEVKADRFGVGAAARSEWVGSTLERELLFLLSHTVHHFALIGLMLRQLGAPVDPTFGVAPSTLEHWGDSTQCVR